MESKLFFVVLVTLELTISSFVSSWPPPCGLTDEGSIDISELVAMKDAAISAKYDANNPIFDGLVKVAAAYLFDLEFGTSDENTTAVLEAIQRDKDGADYVLNSIPIALRKHCDGIEIARSAIHAYIEDSVAAVYPAAELGLSGNYTANRAAIEVYQARVQSDVVKWIQVTYNLLRNCLNTTDADILSAIKTAENGSTTGLLHVANAAFNAIKLLAVAITYGEKSLSLISDVEECRAKALNGLRNEVDSEFSLLEILYINSCSPCAGVVSDLTAMRYSTNVRTQSAAEAVVTTFGEIIKAANRIIYGFYDDGELVYSRTDAARAEVLSKIVADKDYLLDLMAFVSPVNSDVVKNAVTNLQDLMKQVAACYFKMIKLASDQSQPYWKISNGMNVLKYELACAANEYITNILSLIRNGNSWSNEIEAKFAVKKKKQYRIGKNYVGYISDGTKILAKIAHANGTAAYTDEVSAIRVLRSEATCAMQDYIRAVSEAFRFAVWAEKQNLHQTDPNNNCFTAFQ